MFEDQLQADLGKDIETVKQLRLKILPAKKYYAVMIKSWAFVYFSLVSALFLACFFASTIHAWPYTKDFAKKAYKIRTYGHAIPIFEPGYLRLVDEEMKKPLSVKIAEARTQERSGHLKNVFYMRLGVFFISLFLMLVLTGYVQMYVIYKTQVMEHLRTGKYIQRKVRQAFAFFMGLFTFFSLLTVSTIDQVMVGFAAIGSFIVSAIIFSVVSDMELNRIAISPLTDAIADYFEREQSRTTQTTTE